MGRQSHREYFSGHVHGASTAISTTSTSTSISDDNNNTDLVWPFGKLEDLDHDDIREAAYEIFFTACRSSPGFGGRNALSFYSSQDHHGNGDGGSMHGSGGRVSAVVTMTPTSKVKKALGLRMLKRSPSRRMSMSSVNGGGSTPSVSPISHHGHSNSVSFYSSGGFSTVATRPRRPLTSAEIMRQQMRVTEQSDNRLRKTLMRTLVGQMGRRSETIILPLELLRQLKPSEFNDMSDYHFWQRRQLKILEAGLLNHPSIPLEKSNSLAKRLREIIRASKSKPIDTGKNSDTMRTLCNCVVSLSWRSANETSSDACHWADGFPLNTHIYISLLQAIFDIRDETLVLDEVDELLELMKKTWSTLGINRSIHNVCFTWVLFQQYVATNQMEPDLLCAAYNMLTEVAIDAKKIDREAAYVKLLMSMLVSMQKWAEMRLLHYHEYFNKTTVGGVENLLPLALSSMKILGEDVTIKEGEGSKKGDTMLVDSTSDCVDHYIRSSLKNAFAKTWNPKSKSEPYAQSVVELMSIAKEMVNGFFEIPIGITDDSVLDLAEGLEQLIQEYTTFVASCGSKQSYLPSLPPLTRCNGDSKFFKLWRKANPCTTRVAEITQFMKTEGQHPHPSTSRGTQRLYIRINSLHYLASHLHSLDKTLSLSPRVSTRNRFSMHLGVGCTSSSYFEHVNASIQAACDHVSEVAAYRLIFLDSCPVFYETLYVGDVANSRLRPAIRILKQNLALLTAILTDHAQALAMKEVMKASFEAFLMVLLAGGPSRTFQRSDHEMIEDDFDSLKRVFCTCGEGLLSEDIVQREAEVVEGVISLMGQTTEQLTEDFSIVTCEASGIGSISGGQKLPMPPTTGRWNRADPNTILRVLCHRNDRAANNFLKKSFQLAKRN
ncbi:hypothetical protein ES319_D01G026000v1 [Gossypium barbadense]|uniref:MHD1 domain-containing protein n=3 Tax=Gossypium TaxID=3633 RepID=A0A5J5SJJ6_GOSBA|nr:hypothetical protein ES319_D01G026000v1 [Gossypium barbadense]TYG81740.1 hypothetical protein ES288_D01G029800v1 [Gossypium darwinii]